MEAEKQTRLRRIHTRLKASGWSVFDARSFDATRLETGAIRECETASGPADYCGDGVPVGVVEAQKVTLGTESLAGEPGRARDSVVGAP